MELWRGYVVDVRLKLLWSYGELSTAMPSHLRRVKLLPHAQSLTAHGK